MKILFEITCTESAYVSIFMIEKYYSLMELANNNNNNNQALLNKRHLRFYSFLRRKLLKLKSKITYEVKKFSTIICEFRELGN